MLVEIQPAQNLIFELLSSCLPVSTKSVSVKHTSVHNGTANMKAEEMFL